MALMAETTENNAEKQQSHVKPSKGCCARCCACCIQCTSGFIFLLIIAMLVLCVRYFLELPVIINGFVNAAAFTQQTVASEMSNALNISSTATTIEPQNHSPDQVAHNETCQMFVCSFQHSNEVYQPEYNVSSSTKFQTKAAHIQTTLSAIFNTSLLKRAYRNSSVFLLRSDPFTIYTQLLFCNEEDTEGGITDDAVAQILRSYNGSLDISMSTQTVAVGGEAPCPMNSYLSGAWPWQVLIQEEQTAVCFGNVLTGFWLLSSADCLKNRVVSALSVVMISDSSSQNRIWNVSKVIQHPNFTASPTVNNFALIRLSKPIWFDSSIMPTCLPQTAQDPTVGSTCTATIGNVLDVSIAGLVNVNGTTASAISCLGVSQSGIIYITKILSKLQISQMDLGNSLACLNTDSSVSLQGILSNSQDSSICIKYSSIGSAIEWIKSYILT